MVENYPESIQLIAKFTVQSLQVCTETFNLLILKCFATMFAEISVPLYAIVHVSLTLQTRSVFLATRHVSLYLFFT
jgi:hypothetical protein